MCHVTVLSEKIVTARKNYCCNASEFLRDGINDLRGRLSFKELRAIADARKQNWKVIAGERCLVQNNKGDGEMYTFRARPEIHAICSKFDFYPEC